MGEAFIGILVPYGFISRSFFAYKRHPIPLSIEKKKKRSLSYRVKERSVDEVKRRGGGVVE